MLDDAYCKSSHAFSETLDFFSTRPTNSSECCCNFVFNWKRSMDYRNEKGEEKTGTSVLVYPFLKAIKSCRILLAFI